MTYELILTTAHPRALAAVRETVKLREVPTRIQGLLGEVWQFLRENKVMSTGHNVAIYVSGAGEGAELSLDTWFGVEVHESIPASDRVKEVSTPDGRVVSTVHRGEYSKLGEAHDAIRDWARVNGQVLTSTSWEVYGDWNDDWAKVRTDVFYQLEA